MAGKIELPRDMERARARSTPNVRQGRVYFFWDLTYSSARLALVRCA